MFADPAKTRLLSTLIRHASAPASPRLTIDIFNPSEGGLGYHQKRSVPPHRSSTVVASRSNQSLLNELSLSQSLVSRLRRDRDSWRSLAQKQGTDLAALEPLIREQTHTISQLEDQKSSLDRRNEDDRSKGKHLYSRFQGLITKHDKLVDQLNDALRAINQLKKSDRAKGKVQQRNLRLKATLQHYTSRSEPSASRSDGSVEATLLEALAATNERIEELERKGEDLLEALERRDNSSGSDDDHEMEEKDEEAELREAKGAFQGVIEDETFKEQKLNWADLLNE
ncbi:uncharacterized protein K460DRAFT_282971 [Cucurbitaria berberidis CBS 394.84]|uniref:Uncharacterized protein n=1 Tax=Cucurbitaria berberidis CBS 394.84 TaxID=1168544 RepID=A0A9P4GIN2_9PLEO|nr:uncharacterized protein K460DRAFT_282971 [Cucurbitaria berberidis CBS 394.84]KAF1845997.1 hypothetical protein K460DRAFT_282971 [Cucurbitaria berberidis CBS 394.84]